MKKLILLLLIAQANFVSAQTCISGNCENGFGKYKFENGSVYEGYFRNYKQNGKGKCTFASGDVYDGNWENGYQNGFGEYKWSDGSRYEGSYENNVMKGQGTIYYTNGEKYVGECLRSNREGKGVMIYASKEVYDGNWVNNKRNGFGKYTWSEGTRYEGNWVDDEMTGQATILYASGEKYVGENKKGQREGKGIHYNSNGTVSYDGYFKNNEQSSSTGTSTTTTTTKSSGDDNWLDDWLDNIYGEEAVEASKASTSATTWNGYKGAKVSNWGDLYSNYIVSASDATEIKRQAPGCNIEEVKKFISEKNWPFGISSMDGRIARREEMKKYNVYVLAKVGSKYILVVPAAENKNAPYGLSSTDNIYFAVSESSVTIK